jgi:hypothetical protein
MKQGVLNAVRIRREIVPNLFRLVQDCYELGSGGGSWAIRSWPRPFWTGSCITL